MAKNLIPPVGDQAGITQEMLDDINSFSGTWFHVSRVSAKCFSDPYLDFPECNPGVDTPEDRRHCVIAHICLLYKAENRSPGLDLTDIRDKPYKDLVSLVQSYEKKLSPAVRRQKARAIEVQQELPPPPPPVVPVEGDWERPEWMQDSSALDMEAPLPGGLPEWFAQKEPGTVPHYITMLYLKAGPPGIPNSTLVEMVQERFGDKSKAMVTEVIFQARTAQKREPKARLRLSKVQRNHYALTLDDG